MLPEEIASLKKKLIDYATLVEGMIEKSIQGLLNRKRKDLTVVLEKDEPEANRLEVKLDELCIVMIARYEPRAKELRTILMLLKMNNDLERIADHAVNIAQSALFLIEMPQVKPLIDIPRMAETVINMVKDSIHSLLRENPKLAREVCARDRSVNALRDQILRELITFMRSDPTTIERSIHLLRISNNLERIGDLTKNICEEVIYAAEGTVIKHHLNSTI